MPKFRSSRSAMMVYLDNAATTKVDPKVLRVMLPYFSQQYANTASAHDAGKEAAATVEHAREIIAKKLNALPHEIVFTSGGTESNNLALKGVAYTKRKQGNHIITTQVEHDSVLESCRHLEREGFRITFLPVDTWGRVNVPQIEHAITKSTILVSVLHANNEIGTVNDIKKIGTLCRKKNILFHTDAVQSFTKAPLDVHRDHVDLVSLSAHKIHGPKGIGALYVGQGVLLERMLDGGNHEFGLRSGTLNVPGIVGFGKAVGLMKKSDIARMKTLKDFFIRKALAIGGISLTGHPTSRLCNNIHLCFKGISGEEIFNHLDKEGIESSLGAACKSGEKTISSVLQGIGLSSQDASSCIRFTLSKFTTKKELEYVLKKLQVIVESLRKI